MWAGTAHPPPPPIPHFCRIINKYFISSGLKNTIFIQNFNDRVSNESVGSPAFNFAAASNHLKNRSLTHVSFYRQLQTSWLDMFRQLPGLSYELFYSAGLTNFIYQLSVEVSLVKMPPKRMIASFLQLHQSKAVNINWKWNCSGWWGSWGGELIKWNVQFYFQPPHFLVCSAATESNFNFNKKLKDHNSTVPYFS